MTNPELAEPRIPICSACGGRENLFLVTAGVGPGEGGAPPRPQGRLLNYCSACRSQRPPRIAAHDIAVPIEVVTPELMCALYALGITQSDPVQASEIVFGKIPRGLVRKIRRALRKRQQEEAAT